MWVCVFTKAGVYHHLTPGLCVAFVTLAVKGAALAKDWGSSLGPAGASALLVLRLDQTRDYARERCVLLSCLRFHKAWCLCCLFLWYLEEHDSYCSASVLKTTAHPGWLLWKGHRILGSLWIGLPDVSLPDWL